MQRVSGIILFAFCSSFISYCLYDLLFIFNLSKTKSLLIYRSNHYYHLINQQIILKNVPKQIIDEQQNIILRLHFNSNFNKVFVFVMLIEYQRRLDSIFINLIEHYLLSSKLLQTDITSQDRRWKIQYQMEILQTQKELDKNDNEIHRSIAQDLKDIKTVFINIYRQNDPLNIHLFSDTIDSHYRNFFKKLPINQRKVLKAYLDFQLEDAYEKISLKDDIPNKREKNNFSFFPTLKHGRISPNQNKLLELFRSWFLVNMRLAKGLTKRKEIFLKELSEAQEILNLFFERIMHDKEQNSNNKKEKYCEVTLVLILITQFNLCVLLLYRRNYSSVKLLINKFRLIFQILKKQNSQKQAQILKKITLIEQLHKKQEKQVKQYLLQNRVNSLRALNSCKKYPENEQQRRAREQAGQEKINQKYDKAIDDLIQKNKIISFQQDKISSFLEEIGQRMMGLQNALLFQTQTDDIEDKLISTKIKIQLFKSPRLNSVISQIVTEKELSNKITRISQLIFNQRGTQNQDIFLTVAKSRKNLEISIKDYFNLCMFMKKSNMNKEAIIYFEILVFHFRKKNLITSNCLKEDFLKELDDDDDISEQERFYDEERAALGQLQKFIKNQELFKIMMFSLVNLVELYELQSAHYWALQTLKYLSKLIEFKVVKVLQKIYSKLNIFQELNSDDENSHEPESITKEQKECMKLIKKYSMYLQEIKYKIIKCSFNSLTSQIINQNSLPKNVSQKKLNISTAQIPSIVPTPRHSTRVHVSYNMQRLQEKQNQLKSLILSRNGSFNNIKKLYQTGMHSPRDKSEFKNQANDLKKQVKGASYQIKKKKLRVQRTSHNNFSTKNTIFTLQTNKKPSLKQNQKQSVKFNLSTPFERLNQSCRHIKTYVSIGLEAKKKTVNFLDTAKTLDESKKNTRIGELRKKILQNKDELQDHIKLSFMKLNGCLSNAQYSTISLDDVQVQNYDFTSKTEEVLHQFDQLLLALKNQRSHSDESFQREILIDAKVKLLEMIKPKARNQKLIEVCVGLVNDINLMKNSDKRLKLKKKILWQLSSNYHATKQVKKAISTYLQLARLGDSIGYLKIGQIFMKQKDYGNSIKYHQKYALEKNYDLSSKVKLAHAYSKDPQYYMKTIDMLSGILIATGNSSKFKQQIIQRKYDDQLIESAVILLSSLHFKNENIQKAIDLCQNYCKINIKNYRVLHILGGYYRIKGNSKKSFECYLNALQNNPTHHKSLIELTEFICQGYEYKAHAIQLLRKCFCRQSRNFELVKTLVKFLVNGSVEHEEVEKDQLNYQTLLKYAEIFNHSHNKSYSGQNFYEQALLVYEWALNLLDISVTIANLNQIEDIYCKLGEICLKKGDYSRSETYYKLYLSEIQKYVNHSYISEQLKQQKINKTKILIYHFLGKVKQHQHSFNKAIVYFNKSQDLQLHYHEKLPNLESYFYLFQVGYCHFMLGNYQTASKMFNKHRDFLLYFIAGFDQGFFKEEHPRDYQVEAYLELKDKKLPKKKVNYLRQWINGQNQTSSTQLQIDKKESPQDEVQYILKKNYFENQLYAAFCSDMRRKFIQSKEIYKKVLSFIKDTQQTAKKRLRMRIQGKKDQLKDETEKFRQNYIRHIASNYTGLNSDYKGFKKISMINLANIYRIQGLDSKYQQLMRVFVEEFPESLSRNEIERLIINSKLRTDSESISFGIKETDSSLASGQEECIKVFKTTLENLDRVKTKKIHFADDESDEIIKESIKTFFQITPQQSSTFSLGQFAEF